MSLKPNSPRLLILSLSALLLYAAACTTRSSDEAEQAEQADPAVAQQLSMGEATVAERGGGEPSPPQAMPAELELGDPEDPWVASRGDLRLSASDLHHLIAWRSVTSEDSEHDARPADQASFSDDELENHAVHALRWARVRAVAQAEGWEVSEQELSEVRAATRELDLSSLDDSAASDLLGSLWPRAAAGSIDSRLQERALWERYVAEKGQPLSVEELEQRWRDSNTSIRIEIFKIINDPSLARVREIMLSDEVRMREHYERHRDTRYSFPPDIENLIFRLTPAAGGSLELAEQAAEQLLPLMRAEGIGPAIESLRRRYADTLRIDVPWPYEAPTMDLAEVIVDQRAVEGTLFVQLSVMLRPATVLEYDSGMRRRIAVELARAEGLGPSVSEAIEALTGALKEADEELVDRLVVERSFIRSQPPFFTKRRSGFVPDIGESAALQERLFTELLRPGDVLEPVYFNADAAWVIRLTDRREPAMERFREEADELMRTHIYNDGARQWSEEIAGWENATPIVFEAERFRRALSARSNR